MLIKENEKIDVFNHVQYHFFSRVLKEVSAMTFDLESFRLHFSSLSKPKDLIGDKAKVRVNTWIKEGTKIKSENLGATAKNTPLLEPLLFNFRTQEMGIEKTLDGTIMNNGKVFSVKIKKGEKSLTPLRAEMLPKLILLLGQWLAVARVKINPTKSLPTKPT